MNIHLGWGAKDLSEPIHYTFLYKGQLVEGTIFPDGESNGGIRTIKMDEKVES